MKKITFILKTLTVLIMSFAFMTSLNAQTYYAMSSGDYSQTFTGWSGYATNWNGNAILATGSIPAATKTTVATNGTLATISSSTAIGYDASSSTKLVFLATSATDNTSAVACDLNLNFTGKNAGSLSFDYALILNSATTAGRASTLMVYSSADGGSTWATLGGPYTVYNTTGSSTAANSISVSLPTAFNNASQCKVRFYVYNGGTVVGSPSGSRPKISLDNVSVTSVVSTPVPVVTAGTPTGTVGTPFTYQIIATNTPTSYAVTSGTLPAGLTLNTTTGEISGTPTAAGTPSVNVTATNAGGTSVAATLSFTISNPAGQAQTITFGALSSKTYGDATFDLTATASSGLAVSYTSSNTAVATVSGTTVTIVGAGSTNITASQAGNGTYNPATNVVQPLTVTPITLTVADIAVTPKVYTGTNAATITGSLVGIINSDDVTFVGVGTFADVNVGTSISVTSNCSLDGTKAMNYTLIPISGLLGTITIAPQTITFGALASKSISDVKFKLSGSASSSLAITYSSSNPSVATITNDSVFLVGVGTTTITASQAGNSNYSAATSVDQTLTVTGAPIAAWCFYGVGSTSIASFAATTFNSNLVLAKDSITRGAKAAWSVAGNSFRTTGFKSLGFTTDSTDYFEVKIEAVAGKKVSLSTIDAKLAGTASFCATPGVSNQFAYSLNGATFTMIGSPIATIGSPATLPQIDLTGISALQNVLSGTTITLRYFANGQTNTGGWGFYSSAAGTNGLAIGGSVDIDTRINSTSSTSSVVVSNRTIRISNASGYSIFNTQGLRIASSKLDNGNASITLQAGIYIVKAGSVIQKIVIR
ncbi:MAG: beta strand repeat-containing protein [Bacteroidales bacterium]